MVRLTPEEQQELIMVARHNPGFVRLVERWRMAELEALPAATGPAVNVGVLQGRTQVLTELQDALKAALK